MRSRVAHALVAAGLAAVAVAVGASASPIVSERGRLPKPRPNIVVIETDDQTVEQLAVMQKTLRLLGGQGATFDNSFVSLSLCCPSRATFLTGQYAHNHHVLSNRLPDGGYQKLDSAATLPVWLEDAGYRTSFVGKYLNGYGKHKHAIPLGWDDWHAVVDFSYFNYQMNDNGRLRGYGSRPADYQTDVFTRKATRVIRKLAPSYRPFFLWVSYFAPHAGGPHVGGPRVIAAPRPAPRYRSAYDGVRLPQPPSFNEADISDKPPAIRKRRPLSEPEISGIRAEYEKQLEALLSVDDGVARMVKALDLMGELDNTLIVFTNDNGYFHGEHRVPSGKVLVYEPSIRVPLLVRGPGVPAGVHFSQLVSNIDLAPTLLAVARAKPRRVFMDGRSLLPLFHNPKLQWGRDLLIERLPLAGERHARLHPKPIRSNGEIGSDGGNQGRPGTPPDRAYAAIRTPRYIYVDYTNGAKELYDLARDPDELTNVADDTEYASVVKELARRLGRLRDCRAATCRAGPRVELSVPDNARRATAGTCPSRVDASVQGADEPWIRAVRFYANRRLVARARRAPFERAIPRALLKTTGHVPRVRARVAFLDGRRADRIQLVAASCSGEPVKRP